MLQHIFSRGDKKFCRGVLVTGLNICLKSNLQKGNSNASKYSYYKRNTSNFSLILPKRNVVSFMYFQVPVDPNVPKKVKQNLKKKIIYGFTIASRQKF